VRWGRKKWLLRRVLKGILPDDILKAPKMGLTVPYKNWLRNPLADYSKTILLDAGVRNRAIFDEQALAGCIKEHVSGTRDHAFLLWKALNLALWCKMYRVDGLATL
jgi:asparagine synthase (glutamine-hydrolysing)